ncbi:hypothetical protein QUB10_33180 [Microcoleus sp. B5-D4]|uniref:hypothetical protein n=1 Tax=Microcoleus sp. B5-D4 TaxID=2818681 RepID=UPI002FD76091
MARFSDIMRADELKAAKDKLEAYMRLDTAAKQAAYKTATKGGRLLVGKQDGILIPFGRADDKIYVGLKLPAPSDKTVSGEEQEKDNALITSITSKIVGDTLWARTTKPETATVVGAVGRKQPPAARVIFTRKGASADRTSRFTGKTYKSPTVTSVSCPFGIKTGATGADRGFSENASDIVVLLKPTTPVDDSIAVRVTPQGFIDIN